MNHAKAVQNLKTGQAGVLRVASELLLRGFNVAMPIVDDGCDLLAENFIRIQIKSGHLREHPAYPNGLYMFDFRQSSIVTGRNNVRKRGIRDYSRDVDFLILWGIEQGRFWVIPSDMVSGRTLISVGPETQWQNVDMEKVHTLQSEGKLQREIASELGVDRRTIGRRLQGKHVNPKYPSFQIRTCEGRWDFIESHLRTMLEMDEATRESPSEKKEII